MSDDDAASTAHLGTTHPGTTAHPDTAPRPVLGMVWAQTPEGAIASDDALPWDVPEDFTHFRATVAGRPVIVGRTTWETMPPAWRRSRRGRSVIISRNPDWQPPPDGAAIPPEVTTSLPRALALLSTEPDIDPDLEPEVWVMGGGQIYALGLAVADLLVISEIDVPEPRGTITPAPALDPAIWVEDTPDDVGGWRTSVTGTRWRVRHLRRRA